MKGLSIISKGRRWTLRHKIAVQRSMALKIPLTILILFLMLLPHATILTDGEPCEEIAGPLSSTSTSKMVIDAEDAENGFTLVAPTRSNTTFLVNQRRDTVHEWENDQPTQGAAYMLENGTILRCRSGKGVGTKGMGVQMVDWDGTVLWDYKPPQPYSRHHDIEPLPNGNVLIIAREVYTYQEAIDLGRDPALTNDSLWVDPLLEVRPNGPAGGDIVWMWDPTDHIVQEFDVGKPNYGTIADHPELLDVNIPAAQTRDWLHMNAVSYNADLDQIMLTSRNYNEFWVIDHSTTTEEASGHTGGAQGKGGDILYRWGNPQVYGAGGPGDQVLYGPHDAQWIAPGLPGEGNAIVFNNGANGFHRRPEGRFSTVDEITPSLNGTGGYDHTSGEAYGPTNLTWRYMAFPPTEFFAGARSGAQRLPSGNTLICDGLRGKIFEVTPIGNTVWTYTTGPLFKVMRYFPPYLEPVEGQQATEDIPFELDLTPFLVDPDTDQEDLVLNENSSYATILGHELQLLYPEGVTRDVINLTVSDGVFETWTELRVNITPVNDPPVLALGQDLELAEDVPFTLDLEPFISDPDTAIGDMMVTEDSPYATVIGSTLDLLYTEGVLIDHINLTVSDGELEDTREILVRVLPVNDPPTVAFVPDQDLVEDIGLVLDMAPFISDVDTPVDEMSIVSGSPYVEVDGSDVSLLYPEGVTADTVYLTVSDGEFVIDVVFNVTVSPVNDRPSIEDLPPVDVKEDETVSMDIGPYLSDIDTPVEDLTLEVISPYITVEGHVLVLTYPEGIFEDELTVVVSDGELSDDTTLRVTVVPVNDPPWWSDVLEITAVEDVPGEFDLGPFMDDTDTPLLELEVGTDSMYGVVEDRIFRFLYPEGILVERVTFTLSDGEFEVVLLTNVAVAPVNDVPELLGPGVEGPEGNLTGIYRFTVVLRDIDMGTNEPVVEIVIDGVTHACVRVDPGGGTYNEGVPFLMETVLEAGDHTFHFRADDGDGGTATSDAMSVIVSDNEDDPEEDPVSRWDDLAIWSGVLIAVIIASIVILYWYRSR